MCTVNSKIQAKTKSIEASKSRVFHCECKEAFSSIKHRRRHYTHCIRHLQSKVAGRTTYMFKADMSNLMQVNNQPGPKESKSLGMANNNNKTNNNMEGVSATALTRSSTKHNSP